ncbi:DDB1- and CUL4-associated factor 6-like [Paramacrobiotus metropolitanus]|uniref:DDB1- and CUL4-associated factor 6-like n=1 Tax=Paramacrobiotus metropolitanus TaxID=2943436 RepID=UPI002445AEE3|nr:DDB1- and CUL4-associated factor 6-like [Paramacrobiotus metropolitanus]
MGTVTCPTSDALSQWDPLVQSVSSRKQRYIWPSHYLNHSTIPSVYLQRETGSLHLHELQRELRRSQELIQRLQISEKLSSHTGCVNSLDWSDDGEYLLSGSDDLHLAVWDASKPNGFAPYRFKTLHQENIFTVRFLCKSNGRQIVSACGDGSIIYTQLKEADVAQKLIKNHTATVYRVLPLTEACSCFLSCSEDGTVRQFDARQPFCECDPGDNCNHSLLANMEKAVSTIALNPVRFHELAVGCSDSTITFYDRRKMDRPTKRIRCQTTKNMPRRITSLQYDAYGSSLLANVLCEKIQLLDLRINEQLKEGKAKKLEDPKELCPTEPLPIKRLRLRGDWSDTGPQSRPGQRPTEAASGSSRFMVEISDLMTTWMRNQMAAQPAAPSPPAPVITPSERSAGGGGRNDSGAQLMDVIASAPTRNKKFPEDLVIVKPVLEYSGHRSSRTMIKEARFWDDSFVISGSDCGRVFIWDRQSGKLVNVFEGDKHVVNCIQPHPTQFLLATSGIDHDVKIWRPTAEEACFDAGLAENIAEVNNQMLDETRDTVTVPAVCVVRILRAMARRSEEGEQRRQDRSGNAANRAREEEQDGSETEEE